MQTVSQLTMLRKAATALREGGKRTVALVPTMGALHEGHLTLMRKAARSADHVIASIFVNPTQFGEGEDLAAYPRQLVRDSQLLANEGVALLWAPPVEEVYPAGFATSISVGTISENLCGANRPGHFDGVATIVCKLFNQVRPDMAFFGEKDWQQLAVIRTMARDLDLTMPHAETIYGVQTIREADGLAMSSRNAYLSVDDRAHAAMLPTAMRDAIANIAQGENVETALKALQERLLENGFSSVDYADWRDADSLVLHTEQHDNARLFVAARIGGTRLIDNMPALQTGSG